MFPFPSCLAEQDGETSGSALPLAFLLALCWWLAAEAEAMVYFPPAVHLLSTPAVLHFTHFFLPEGVLAS